MRIFVIGGNRFVGRQIVETLHRHENSVGVLDTISTQSLISGIQ